MVSKACIVGQYQKKLQALAQHPDLELTVVVPPFWRDEWGDTPVERAHTEGYTLLVERMALNGHFHLHFYPTLPQVIQRIRPDIVHIDEEPYNTATWHSLRAAKKVGARTIFFTWQNLLRRYPPPFSWIESYVFRHCDYAIAGNCEAERVLRAKSYHGPSRVIPQFGVDASHFCPGPKTPGADATLRIGFVGRFVDEKGAQVLLRAVAGLSGAWELHLLGQGPLKEQLQQRARELRIESRVRFDLPRPSAEMPAYMRGLDVLVVPSLTRSHWKEQFGRVLIEAMACQVPVIGSNCGEIPNVIGDAGLIFPENDHQALTSLIDRLRREPGLDLELGKRGRARVLANFTHERIADETLSVYRHLAAGAIDR